MDTEFWISELSRLYKRSTEAINEEQYEAVEPLAEQFNETLTQLQEEFPDHAIISSVDPVDAYTDGATGTIAGMKASVPPSRREAALHEVRSQCEKMANALGYELPEYGGDDLSSEQMVMVSVDSSQEVQQDVSTEVVQQTIVSVSSSQSEQEELRRLLERFEEELDGEQNESKLREVLVQANEISKDVASQMAVLALKRGLTEILSL